MVAAEEDLGPAPDQMAPEEAASNIPQTAVPVDSEGITVVSVDSSAVIDENAAEISGLAKRIQDEMQVIMNTFLPKCSSLSCGISNSRKFCCNNRLELLRAGR